MSSYDNGLWFFIIKINNNYIIRIYSKGNVGLSDFKQINSFKRINFYQICLSKVLVSNYLGYLLNYKKLLFKAIF